MANISGGTATGTDSKDTELQSVTKTGNPPKRRVDNAEAAYNIFDKMKRHNETLAYNRSKVQGQQDGNAPFNKTQRKRLGLGWTANCNYGDARSTVRLNATSVWNMLTSVAEFIELTLKSKKDEDKQQPSADYGQIIAEEFTDTLIEDEDFYHNLLCRTKEMATHGLGPAIWLDEINWRSEFVKISNVLFPKKTKSKKSGLKVLCFRDEMDPVDLFKKIGDGDPDKEKIAQEEGWNVRHTKEVLINAYKYGQSEYTEYSQNEWESLQTKLKNHDYEYDAEFEGVRCVHMLVTEIGGACSHMIFYEEDPGKKDNEGKSRRAFMFDKQGRFESMQTAVHFFMFDVGNGYMASIRGLGYELFQTSDIKNKMINSTVDGAILGNSIMAQPESGGDIGKLQITKLGSLTVIPPEVNVIQSSFSPTIEPALRTIGLMERLDNTNAGVYQSGQDAVTQVQKTATQSENEAVNEARFQGDHAAWIYIQWESWLKETFRRLINPDYPEDADGYAEHKEFIQRCLDRDVPKELLVFDKWKLKAVRAIGMGSAVQAVRLTDWLLNRTNFMDERGRINAFRDAIQVRMGQSKADRYLPIQSRDLIATRAHSLANLENNDMLSGNPAIAGVDQHHKIHITLHMDRMNQVAEAIGQNVQAFNMIEMDKYFKLGLSHTAEHFQYLALDETRKADLESLRPQFEQILQFSKMVESQAAAVEKQKAEAEKKRQQLVLEAKKTLEDRQHELELEKIASSERVAMANAESLARTREFKTMTQIQNQQAKTIADIERKFTQTIAEIERENAKLAAELQRMQAEVSVGEEATT